MSLPLQRLLRAVPGAAGAGLDEDGGQRETTQEPPRSSTHLRRVAYLLLGHRHGKAIVSLLTKNHNITEIVHTLIIYIYTKKKLIGFASKL